MIRIILGNYVFLSLPPDHPGKSATSRESNHGLVVCKEGALREVLCTKKLHFASQNWLMEN